MIVDTSALIAILKGEAERDDFIRVIAAANPVRISSGNYLETAVVVDSLGDPVKSRQFDDLIEALGVEVVAITEEHARIARAAYRDFGRGSGHPARLNFADCFAYALAKATREPLLYKGDDFGHTDVAAAGPSSR